jgi:hypothetical protein
LRLPRRALCQQALCEIFINPTPLELLQERAIATLPRTVTRIEERLPKPFVINQADLNETCDSSTHMLFRVPGSYEALFKTPARARCAAERACSCLQHIGGLCRCSAGFLRFRVAATRHDAPLLRFGSDGDRNLKRR